MLATMASCGGSNKIDPIVEPEEELLIDTTLIFSPMEGMEYVHILSHASWKAEVTMGAAWCTVTPTSGGSGGATIAIKVTENDEFAVRRAVVKFQSSMGKGEVEVIQQQIDVLDLTMDEGCDFGPQGGSFAVKLDYNIDYQISCDADWVHQTQTKALQHATLLFAVDKNATGSDRSCRLTFEGSDISHVVTVNQTKAYISLSIDDIALGDADTYLPMMVESNVSYTLSMPDVDWLSFEGTTGAGTDGEVTATRFDFSLQENTEFFLRECKVAFGNPDYKVTDTLRIVQKALDIMYEPFPLEAFGPEGGSFTFDIDPSAEYKITAGEASWIGVSVPDDMPWRRVVTVEKNMTGEERSGGLKLTRGNRSKTLDVNQRGAHIDLSADSFEFPSMGGSRSLTVDGNVEYVVSKPTDASWCTIEKGEDGAFTITVARNPEETGRECSLTFTNEEYKITHVVTISQAQLDAFEVSPAAFEIEPQGGRIEVSIHANVEFDCEQDADWISEDIAARTSEMRVYDVARNSGADPRQGRLTFRGAGLEHVVTVNQTNAYLTASPRRFEYDDSEASGDFSVTGNIGFKAKVLEADWLTITETTSGGVQFHLLENNDWGNRTGWIVVYNDGYEATDTVTVWQGAKYYLDIDQTEFSLPPQGGDITLKVVSNKDYDYHIADSPDWIREKSQLMFEIDRNVGKQAREAEIVFEQNGQRKSVIVTQDAPYLIVDVPKLEFEASGGEATFTVSGNVPFDMTDSGSEWLECIRESASSFKVTVEANDVAEDRESTIKVASPDYDCIVEVRITQAAKGIFELLTSEFSFGPEGGRFTVEVNTNVDYSYSVEGDWIAGAGGLEFTVDRNLSDSERIGRITFEANGYAYDVTVNEGVALLEVAPEQLLFAVEGGEGTFTVSANIEYEIVAPDDEWITCSDKGEGSYLVAVSTNDGDDDRESSITVRSEAFERAVNVAIVQPRSDFFNLLTPSFALGPDMTEIEVEVATNLEYTYLISEDWVNDAGGLRFSVARNKGQEGRECTITFNVADETYDVSIVQDAPYLTLTEQTFQVDSVGGQVSIGVATNIGYEMVMPQTDWLACTDTLDGPVYLFDVARNDDYEARSCTVTFSAENFGIAPTAKIKQVGNESLRPFSVTGHDFFIGPTGGEIEIPHTKCNDVEVAIYSATWIHELPERRKDTLLVFSVDTSFSASAREAAVSITGNGRSVTTYVFQNPPSLVISGNQKAVSEKGGTVSFNIISNFTPQLYTDADWLKGTVSQDGKSITFSANRNDTGADREAVVDVGLRSHDYYKTVTVTQKAADMVRITPSLLNVEAESGEYYVTIVSNKPINFMGHSEWLTCTATGEENQYLVTVSANTNSAERYGFVTINAGELITELEVCQAGFRNPDYYYSEDFSENGVAVRLQTASMGAGIPLVLMGDAFSDRLIADGTYEGVMRKTMEAVFDIEPYKSFRNMFDVWYVKIVSLNEIYAEDTATALNTQFVKGTVVTGNHNEVQQIALNLLDSNKIKNAAIIVLMNTEKYGGTTYLYDFVGESGIGDYGEGFSIAYIPLCTSEAQFTQVVQHEVGGHGIGKLEDEYYYADSGEIPSNKVDSFRTYQSAGYYKNVDFTSDPAQVLWAKFIADEDYQYDGLGVFEGACLYTTGAYRATEESMMYHNEGPFNAPSREAIYYHLHKLAYGNSWQYDYDAFKQYDAVNRKTSPSASQSSVGRGRIPVNPLCPEPLPSPVFIK